MTLIICSVSSELETYSANIVPIHAQITLLNHSFKTIIQKDFKKNQFESPFDSKLPFESF